MHGHLDPCTSPSSSPTARTHCFSTASCRSAAMPVSRWRLLPELHLDHRRDRRRNAALEQSISFAVAAKAPVEQFRAHADARGWRHARLLSSAKTTYNRDYHAEASDGSQLPMATVFTRRGGAIRHFWSSEAARAPTDEGQHPRHVDFMWPLWAMLDRTPEGRGSDWSPRLEYS